jgi:hypothetical protein
MLKVHMGSEETKRSSNRHFFICMVLFILILPLFGFVVGEGSSADEEEVIVHSPPPVQEFSAKSVWNGVRVTWKTPTISNGSTFLECTLFRASIISPFEKVFFSHVTPNRTYTFNDDTTKVGTTYFYRINVTNRTGISQNNPVIEIIPKGPPSQVKTLYATSSLKKVKLQWDPPVQDGGSEIQGYIVKVGRDRNRLKEITRVDQNTTEWEHHISDPKEEKCYSVTAFNEYGEGEEDWYYVSTYERDEDDVDTIILILLLLMLIPGSIVGGIAYLIKKRKERKIDDGLIDVEEFFAMRDL